MNMFWHIAEILKERTSDKGMRPNWSMLITGLMIQDDIGATGF